MGWWHLRHGSVLFLTPPPQSSWATPFFKHCMIALSFFIIMLKMLHVDLCTEMAVGHNTMLLCACIFENKSYQS